MFSKEMIYRYAFSQLLFIGPKRFEHLCHFFNNDLEEAWHEIERYAQKVYSKKQQDEIRQLKNSFIPHEEIEVLGEQNIHLTYPGRDDFPSNLSEIPDPPILLYYKGNLPNNYLLTIVGTRRPSLYGRRVTEKILSQLAAYPVGIMSGLALGIDSISHKLALDHDLYTAAFLGSGVNKIRPSSNSALSEKILGKGGALFSEYPPNQECTQGSFPRRNRLLAGISKVTLIIEAAEKSGALITARFAADYNRDVAAIPGSIFSSMSKGCHSLLRQGALLIESPEEIIELLGLHEQSTERKDLSLSDNEQKIYELLDGEPQPLDLIRSRLPFTSAALLAILTEMELKHLIKHYPGRGYCRE